MTQVHILLIDDHAMFRTGLRMVLEAGRPGATIYEAGALDEATATAPDHLNVVLLDIHLNGLNGLDGIALLQRKWPLVPILMLSSLDEPETVSMALARGAAGFISKAETAEKIVEAINQVLLGQLPGQSAKIAHAVARRLTPRQCEVLNLLAQGLSNKLIARQLALSDNTVRRHVQDILEYLQVSSRAEAVFAARKQGLIG